jgi:hypothetical protein
MFNKTQKEIGKMKKLMVVLMSVLLASFAFAQFDLGIKLGANYSYIDSEEFDVQQYVDEFSDLQNITGFVGGAFAVIGFGNFGIQLEGLFSMEGFSIEEIVADGEVGDIIDNTTIRTNYLNAVAMARYNLPLPLVSPFIGVGVNIGVPLGDAVVEGQEIDLDNFDFNQLGLTFAGGVKLLDMVDVELRYVQGLTDIYSLSDEDNEPTFSNLIRLSLGLYIF